MDHKLYLSDPGIFKKNDKFYYNKTGKQVVESNQLERLNKLRVPPAWGNVWYTSSPKCHIQVHGIDANGKRQYILSEKWVNNSRYTKYLRMKSFIKDLKSFKKKINILKAKNDREQLIFLLFNLLIDTHIRVGNEIYAETNGSYGLTTLRQKHCIFKDNIFTFSFLGKSNINHIIVVPEKYNPFLKKLKKNNGNGPLFYYNSDKILNSEDLNNYLKTFMGKDYTCKDFRTYSANMLFIKAFLKNSKKNEKVKKIVLDSIDSTAQHLGHSRNISRKSYISNNLLDYCLDSFETASLCSESDLLAKVWEESCEDN
jgi:DNA topoisomerase-1